MTLDSPHIKESGFQNPGNFHLGESGILGFLCQNTTQGIRNPSNDWNPESKFHRQRLKSSAWNPESMAWSPESKTVLDSLSWGEIEVQHLPSCGGKKE